MSRKRFMNRRKSCFILCYIFLFNIISIIVVANITINIKNDERIIEDPNSLIYTSSIGPPNKHFFQYYKTITIDHEQVNGTGDHKNFPVLISLFDSDLKDHVKQSNGNDIAFANNTAWLDHEIELFDQTYNSTHAKLIAWVRISYLHTTKFTEIDMYYGNSTMGLQENPENVWDPNFKGVWHLSEDPSGSPPQMKDSTSNHNHGEVNRLDTDDQVDGQIDGSIDFDNDQDYINCTDDSSLNVGSGEFSLSLWFNYDGVDDGFLAGKGAYFGGIRYDIEISELDRLKVEIDDGDVQKTIETSSTFNDNIWHYVVLVRDENFLLLYLDGYEYSFFPIPGYGSLDNALPFYINTLAGDNSGTISDFTTTKLDEVRVSNSARSADWIATEYNNQYDPSSFYSIGKERRVFSHPLNAHYFKYYKIITIDHNQVNGTLDHKNFPVLISCFDEDLHDYTQTNGNDIAFSQGISWLDHEIELFDQTYNETHAQLLTWIRIPSLSPSIDTNITMYFGNSTIGPQQNPSGVWTAGYTAVWHLNESQTGIGHDNVYRDSTSNNNHGNDYILATGKEGQIDGGQEFNGVSDYIDSSDIGSFTNLTVSAWIKPKDWGQAGDDYIQQIIGDEEIFAHSTLSFRIGSRGLESYKQRLGLAINISSTWSDFESLSNLSLNIWQHVVVTFDGNEVKFYINGNNDNSQSNPGIIINTGNTWDIGCVRNFFFRYFDGSLDELRISDTAFKAKWIATEYNNQYDPQSFFSISSKKKLDNTPPTYSNLIESSDPLELGDTEVITISVSDPSGINQVKIEFIGSNHSMTNIGGDTWQYDSWTPNNVDNYSYTIWMEDKCNNWNSTIGTIEVIDTTPPTYSDLIESADPLQIGENETITIKVYDSPGSGVNQVLLEYDSSNYTMVFIGGDTWSWSKWQPAIGIHPYKIFMQDMENNWNLASGMITVVEATPPIIENLTKSEDPLELGNMITIGVDVFDVDTNVSTVLIELDGVNHTMPNIGGNSYEYNWTSSYVGNVFYTIYANDSANNWGSISDSILIQDTTLPVYSNLLESTDPLELGDTPIISVDIYDFAGINQTFIEIEGGNYSMTNIGGETWQFDSWTPNNWIVYEYKIHAEDNNGNWHSLISNITIQDTTPPSQPLLANSPSGDVNGIIVFDWVDGFDYSGIAYYILIIDNETNPLTTPGYVYIFNITNIGPESSYCELPEILPLGRYYFFLAQVDGVGNQGDYTMGTFTVISSPGDNIFLIIVIILVSIIGSATAIVLVRKKLKKEIVTPRQKIPLKIIFSHLNRLSSGAFLVKAEKIQRLTDEKEIEISINKIKSLGEELFAEGAYLEAQKQFKHGRDLLISLGREEEAKLFSELTSGIEGLIEEREKRLDILEQVKLEGNAVKVFELYDEIIVISKKLRDPDSASFYMSELIRFFQVNQFKLNELEEFRNNLEQKADSLFNNNQFEIAAQTYGKCEIISQIFIQLEREEEVVNFEKFRNRKSNCLRKVS